MCDENLLNFSGRSGAKECFALFDHFLLGSGRLGFFAFSFRLVSAWFFPVVFYLTDSKGAKECKSCRAQKMLQNAPFLAIVAVDTDENEPSKVRQLDN